MQKKELVIYDLPLSTRLDLALQQIVPRSSKIDEGNLKTLIKQELSTQLQAISSAATPAMAEMMKSRLPTLSESMLEKNEDAIAAKINAQITSAVEEILTREKGKLKILLEQEELKLKEAMTRTVEETKVEEKKLEQNLANLQTNFTTAVTSLKAEANTLYEQQLQGAKADLHTFKESLFKEQEEKVAAREEGEQEEEEEEFAGFSKDEEIRLRNVFLRIVSKIREDVIKQAETKEEPLTDTERDALRESVKKILPKILTDKDKQDIIAAYITDKALAEEVQRRADSLTSTHFATLTAAVEEAKKSIGQREQTLAADAGKVQTSVTAVEAKADEAKTSMATSTQAVVSAASEAKKTLQTSVTDAVADAKKSVTDAVADAKKSVTDAVADAQKSVTDAVADAQKSVTDAKTSVTNATNEAKTSVTNAANEAKTSVTNAVSEAKTTIETSTKEVTDAAIKAKQTIETSLTSKVAGIAMMDEEIAKDLVRAKTTAVTDIDNVATEMKKQMVNYVTQKGVLLDFDQIEDDAIQDMIVPVFEKQTMLDKMVDKTVRANRTFADSLKEEANKQALEKLTSQKEVWETKFEEALKQVREEKFAQFTDPKATALSGPQMELIGNRIRAQLLPTLDAIFTDKSKKYLNLEAELRTIVRENLGKIIQYLEKKETIWTEQVIAELLQNLNVKTRITTKIKQIMKKKQKEAEQLAAESKTEDPLEATKLKQIIKKKQKEAEQFGAESKTVADPLEAYIDSYQNEVFTIMSSSEYAKVLFEPLKTNPEWQKKLAKTMFQFLSQDWGTVTKQITARLWESQEEQQIFLNLIEGEMLKEENLTKITKGLMQRESFKEKVFAEVQKPENLDLFIKQNPNVVQSVTSETMMRALQSHQQQLESILKQSIQTELQKAVVVEVQRVLNPKNEAFKDFQEDLKSSLQMLSTSAPLKPRLFSQVIEVVRLSYALRELRDARNASPQQDWKAWVALWIRFLREKDFVMMDFMVYLFVQLNLVFAVPPTEVLSAKTDNSWDMLYKHLLDEFPNIEDLPGVGNHIFSILWKKSRYLRKQANEMTEYIRFEILRDFNLVD